MNGLISKALSRGLDEVEVYSVKVRTISYSVAKDRISEGSMGESRSIGITGVADKRLGSIHVNAEEYDPDRILDKLVSIVKSSPQDPRWRGFPSQVRKPSEAICLDKSIELMDEERFADLIEAVINFFKDPVLRKGVNKAEVAEGSFIAQFEEISVANSNGLEAHSHCTRASIWLTLSIEKNGYHSDKSFAYVRRKLDLTELTKLASEEGERALLFFNSTPIESGSYEVILTPEVTSLILSYALIPAFSALDFMEKRSPLTGKLGEEILNPQVKLVDNPLLPLEAFTRPFDDEGVGTTAKTLVDKGVVQNLLHNFYTASYFQTEPGGNGFRSSPGSRPLPRRTNVILEPGKGGPLDFSRDVRNGLIVYEVIGYWMSNPYTGNTKVTVTHGLLVKNGEIVKPVKGVVIAGNVYEWLGEKLVAIGSDRESHQGVITPSVWIRGVNVAGE